MQETVRKLKASWESYKEHKKLKQAFRLYIPTQLGATVADDLAKDAYISGNHTGDVVHSFFSDEKTSALLLLGSSGSGKTLFGQFLVDKLWEENEKNAISYIPLFLPLFVLYAYSKLPIERTADSLTICLQNYYGLTATDCANLKKEKLFIFLDSYDEISESDKGSNIFSKIKLEDWQVKVIVSCRTEELARFPLEVGLNLFVPKTNGLLRSYHIQEFSTDKKHIRQYIRQYIISQLKYSKTEGEKLDNLVDEYDKNLQKLSGIREFITNPLVLFIVIEALPKLLSEKSHYENSIERYNLTRIEIYKHFLEKWYHRQKEKLIERRVIDERWDIQKDCELYCEKLAGIMWQKGITSVAYDAPSSYSYYGAGAAAAAAVSSSFSTAEAYINSEDSLPSNRETIWDDFFSDGSFGDTTKPIVIIRQCCPIRNDGSSYSFLHISILEYYASQKIFKSAITKAFVALDMDINLKRLTRDEACRLADIVKIDSTLKSILWEILDESKYEERVSVASANSATILISADSSALARKDLTRVRIRGADLRNADLEYTQFEEADLREVNFTNALLNHANLNGAFLDRVIWGISPMLTLKEPAMFCSFSGNAHLFIGASKNIFIYNRQSFKLENEFKLPSQSELIGVTTDNKLIIAVKGKNAILNEIALFGVSENSSTPELHAERQLIEFPVIKNLRLKTAYFTVSADCELAALVNVESDFLTIGLFNVKPWKPIKILKTPTTQNRGSISDSCFPRKSLCLSADKKILVFSQGHDIRWWNITEELPVLVIEEIPEHAICCFDIGYNNNILAVGYASGALKLWHLNTRTCLSTYQAGFQPITSIVFSPDGETFAFVNNGNFVNIWNREEVQGHYISNYDPVENKANLIIGKSSLNQRSSFLWKMTKLAYDYFHPMLDTDNIKATFCREDQLLVITDTTESLCFFDKKTLSSRRNIKSPEHIREFSISSDTNYAALSVITRDHTQVIQSHAIQVWHIPSHEKIIRIDISPLICVTALSFSPDNKRIYICTRPIFMEFTPNKSDAALFIIDIDTAMLVKVLDGWNIENNLVRFSPDMKMFIAGGYCIKSLRQVSCAEIWRADTQALVGLLEQDSSIMPSTIKSIITITCLAFSSDSRFLVVGSSKPSLQVWDINQQKSFGKLKGHKYPIVNAVFSPDRRYVLSGDSAGDFRVWRFLGGYECVTTIKMSFPLNSWSISYNPCLLAISDFKTKIATGNFDWNEFRFESAGLLNLRLYEETEITTDNNTSESKNVSASFRLLNLRVNQTKMLDVYGLESPNAFLLSQSGAIVNRSLKTSDEIIQIRKHPISYRHNLMFPFYSKDYCPIHVDAWGISLVRKKNQGLDWHAFLLLQSVENGHYRFRRLDLRLQGYDPTAERSVTKSCYGRAIIEIADISSYDIRALVSDCEGMSESIEAYIGKQLLDNVRQDQAKPIQYFLLESYSKSIFFQPSSADVRHNCRSWCYRKLEQINVKFKDNKWNESKFRDDFFEKLMQAEPSLARNSYGKRF